MIPTARIYVASSWRNEGQPQVVKFLLGLGCEVYDFRNPEPGQHGFAWSSIDPNWKNWTVRQYREALDHPVAKQGWKLDINAMYWCDICVLALPAGRSASYELGWCIGAGKQGIVYLPEGSVFEPELMFRQARIVVTLDELREAIQSIPALAFDSKTAR